MSRFLITQFVLHPMASRSHLPQTPSNARPSFHLLSCRPVVHQSWQSFFSSQSWVISTTLCISYLSLSWINIFCGVGTHLWVVPSPTKVTSSEHSGLLYWQICTHFAITLDDSPNKGLSKSWGISRSAPYIPWISHCMKAVPREGPGPWWDGSLLSWAGGPFHKGTQLNTFHCQCFRDWGMHDSGVLGGPGGLLRVRARGWDVLGGLRTQKLGGVSWVREPRASQWGWLDSWVVAEPAALPHSHFESYLTQIPSGSALSPVAPTLFKTPHFISWLLTHRPSLGTHAEAASLNAEGPCEHCPQEALLRPLDGQCDAPGAGGSSGVHPTTACSCPEDATCLLSSRRIPDLLIWHFLLFPVPWITSSCYICSCHFRDFSREEFNPF